MPFDPARDIPDLSGKVILVTGGNLGIGAEIVKALAAHNPSSIYICARSQSSAEELIESTKQQHPNSTIEYLPLDLSSFDSIRKCADDFKQNSSRLDLLFLNAAISATLPALTKEGYESQFGINHVGHALLTQLLLPKLLQTAKENKSDVRIVLTSSAAARDVLKNPSLSLEQMQDADALQSALQRYANSKLANIHFARKLAQLYPSITSTSFNPGMVKTGIWSKGQGAKWIVMLMMPMVWLIGVTPAKGAETGLWCATAKVGNGGVKNGACYDPVGKLGSLNKLGEDQKTADKLWEWTTRDLALHGAPGWPQL